MFVRLSQSDRRPTPFPKLLNMLIPVENSQLKHALPAGLGNHFCIILGVKSTDVVTCLCFDRKVIGDLLYLIKKPAVLPGNLGGHHLKVNAVEFRLQKRMVAPLHTVATGGGATQKRRLNDAEQWFAF